MHYNIVGKLIFYFIVIGEIVMSSSEYIIGLMRELEEQGVKPPEEINEEVVENVDTRELQIIAAMEQITGKEFSDEQRKILQHHGNACILACAGSGKTTISVNLIAKRIMSGEIKDVNKLIYTTFSKAGANEMKERLDTLLKQLGMGHIKVQVRTLHSFFLSVIKTFGLNKRIISASERSKMVRQACKDADFSLKDDDLMTIDNLLSYQMNNLLTNKKLVDSYVNTLDDLTVEKYSVISASYRKQKEQADCMDYDDMQYYLWLWLVKWQKSSNDFEKQTSTSVRNYCKAVYTDFYIDEAQDVSKIQYEIIKAIVSDPNNSGKLDRNLVFIGDDDQCLPEGTKVITEHGTKNIEDIQCWDKVLTGVGSGDTSFEVVDNVSKRLISDELIEIHTKRGQVIRATKNHVGFVKIVPNNDVFYTYLMYRHDIGFRIGTTSGVRAGNRGELRNGIDIRLMQERSDKIWIIKTSESKEQSLYWEAYYAYKYSIPMYRFVTSYGDNSIPKTALNEKQVKRLHKELDTFSNGVRLLSDLGMSYEFPHRIPQAEGDRCKINHSWFTTKASNKYGVHNSEININTSNQKFIETFKDILRITDRSTATKYNYANGRKTDSNIDNQLDTIKEIVSRCKDNNIYVEVDTSAKFTNNKYIPMTFGNMVNGMLIPTLEEYTTDNEVEYRVVDDEIVSINKVLYNGYVYDLSVPDIRNFSANNVLVHNCIYQWRGSDPSIILTIGAKFNMQTFVLSTNYRCLNEIVDYAATGIKCNNSRFAKSMNAFNTGGSVKICTSAKEDLCSLSILALNQIKYWIANGDKVSDIAVLSRNNFHLALLSNMLLREGIYCNMTEDMKLTKSYMYSDIKDLIALSEPNWNTNLTASTLWKLCRYMGASNSRVIASFQNTFGLTLEDTLGWLIKHFVKKDLDFNKKFNISLQAEQQMQYQMNRISGNAIDDMISLYETLSNNEDTVTADGETLKCREVKITNLMKQYLGANTFRYKSQDKARSINGLVQYVINLMKKDGVDKMLEFMRVTEQLESGRMVIPGEKLTLTTIHSAKGREWKDVIMFACDNVSQPSFDGIRGMMDEGIPVNDIYENIDEERRLFYVGNTRAKENLFVITYKQPSVFIMEALGAFDSVGGNDEKIAELVRDNNWHSNYQDIIQEKILSSDSKYFYNPDDYKA